MSSVSLYPHHMKELPGNFLFPYFLDPVSVAVQTFLRKIFDVPDQLRELSVDDEIRTLNVTGESRRKRLTGLSRAFKADV